MKPRIKDKSVTVGRVTLVQLMGDDRKMQTLESGERGRFLLPADPLGYALPGGGKIQGRDRYDERDTIKKATDMCTVANRGIQNGICPRIVSREDGGAWTVRDRRELAAREEAISELERTGALPNIDDFSPEAKKSLRRLEEILLERRG